MIALVFFFLPNETRILDPKICMQIKSILILAHAFSFARNVSLGKSELNICESIHALLV